MLKVKLNYQNGDFRILLKSDIPASKHRLVRAYLLEMHSAMAGKAAWPIKEYAESLYRSYTPYYAKIFRLLGIDDFEHLTPSHRHFFLVCTEPVEEYSRLGLCWLEQLMGFSYEPPSEPTPATNKAPPPTTGDEALDVFVDLCLIFKKQAPLIWQSCSLEECALMCRQANDRMRDPEDTEAGEWIPDAENQELLTPEDGKFAQNKSLIVEKLTAMNLRLPDDF